MKVHQLALRGLRRRPISTFLTALSVALGVGLFSAIGSVRKAGEIGFQRSAALCNLVVGAKGSSLELVLNTIYHQGASAGNIPVSVFNELQKTPGVEWASPIVLGDHFEGHRIVGTDTTLFRRARFSDGTGIGLQGGRLFFQEDHHFLGEAVFGSYAASESGLHVGDTFIPTHDVMASGLGAKHHEEAETRVVGILHETGTPLDRAIFISKEDFYHIKGHQVSEEDEARLAGSARDPKGLSAVLVKTKPGFYHINLFRELNARYDIQAARPADEIRNLFQIVGGVDQILRLVSLLVLFVALLGVGVSLSGAMATRSKEFAIFRALGARRRTLLGMVIFESAFLSLLGGFGGLILSGVLIFFASKTIHDLTGVTISSFPGLQDGLFLGLVVLCGALAGLVPALRAYKTEPSIQLSLAT